MFYEKLQKRTNNKGLDTNFETINAKKSNFESCFIFEANFWGKFRAMF